MKIAAEDVLQYVMLRQATAALESWVQLPISLSEYGRHGPEMWYTTFSKPRSSVSCSNIHDELDHRSEVEVLHEIEEPAIKPQ